MDNVIVIGAGPGGNNAALHLARNGCDVTVIDRKNQIGDKLCTGIVGAECLERFPAHKSLIIREAKSAKFISPAGIEVDLSKDSVQAYVLDRVSYVASFAEEAKEAGAVYLKGSVSSVKVQPSWVEIEVEDSQGTRTLKAEAVIISGGFGSKFTRQLGMGCVNDFATGAQAEVVAPDLEQVHIYLGHHIAPNFFAWLVPTSPNRALVGLLARRNAGAYLKTFISKLQTDNKISTVTKGATQWGVPLQPLTRTYGDRALVVGDAAGQVKPTTGGGIYYALMAGQLASETLQQAFSVGDLSRSQLSLYEKGWKRLMLRDIEVGRGSRQLFEALKDRQIDSLMKTIATNGIRSDILNSKEFSFDWHGGTITRALGHPLLSGALRIVSPLATRMAARIVTN